MADFAITDVGSGALRLRSQLQIVRDLGDVLHCKNKQGAFVRIELKRCAACNKRIQASQLSVLGICCSCAIERRAKAAEEHAARHLERRYIRFQAEGSSVAMRKALMLRAAPKWRDRSAISNIYKEAKRRTKETGVKHHVDHYYPIKGVLSCGLHVHQNLRVIEATENILKSNDHPLDESPALNGMTDLEIMRFADEIKLSPRPA